MHQQKPAAAAEVLQPAVDKLRQLNGVAPADITIREAMIDALLLNADLATMQKDPKAYENCDAVRIVLRPLVTKSADFKLLAPWVKAHACLDQSGQVNHIKKQLDAMPYRDADYLNYLSTHPPKKATS